MNQIFNKGKTIFHYSFQEEDLHGFGKILRQQTVQSPDEAVTIRVNDSKETETTADSIMIPSKDIICRKCGNVVCIEPDYSPNQYNQLYCPCCDEYKSYAEVQKIGKSTYHQRLKTTIEAFKTKFSK